MIWKTTPRGPLESHPFGLLAPNVVRHDPSTSICYVRCLMNGDSAMQNSQGDLQSYAIRLGVTR